jgi:hypothetical protein
MLSVCMCVPFQFFDQCSYFHEIWYRRYDIEGQPIIVNFLFSTISNNSMTDALICEVEATLEPLNSEY